MRFPVRFPVQLRGPYLTWNSTRCLMHQARWQGRRPPVPVRWPHQATSDARPRRCRCLWCCRDQLSACRRRLPLPCLQSPGPVVRACLQTGRQGARSSWWRQRQAHRRHYFPWSPGHGLVHAVTGWPLPVPHLPACQPALFPQWPQQLIPRLFPRLFPGLSPRRQPVLLPWRRCLPGSRYWCQR